MQKQTLMPSLEQYWVIKAAPFIGGLLLLAAVYCIHALMAPQQIYAGQAWSAVANRSVASIRTQQWHTLEGFLFSALLWMLLPTLIRWQTKRGIDEKPQA